MLNHPDRSDKEFKRDVKAVTDYYLNLNSMSLEYGTVRLAKPEGKGGEKFAEFAQAFVKRHRELLRQHREEAPGVFARIAAGDRNDSNHRDTFSLFSFRSSACIKANGEPLAYPFSTEWQGKYDRYILSNMRAQDTGFLHVTSEQAIRKRIDQEGMRRIYLNPRLKDAPAIFRQIIEQSDKDGLPLYGKISLDAYSKSEYGFADEEATDPVRSESIVLYAERDAANQILDMVAKIYAEHKDAFDGRPTPMVAMEVADGIALADESSRPGQSFNQERAAAYASVVQIVSKESSREYLGDKITGLELAAAIRRFRQMQPAVLRAAGINPRNPAFNL